MIFRSGCTRRVARMAVSTLLKLDRKPPPIYQGRYDIKVLYHALRALCS